MKATITVQMCFAIALLCIKDREGRSFFLAGELGSERFPPNPEIGFLKETRFLDPARKTILLSTKPPQFLRFLYLF
jgi:hypothetical protein